jgi:hypothetical protein
MNSININVSTSSANSNVGDLFSNAFPWQEVIIPA